MLRIRLQRRGKKNYATYRVVVADQRAPVKGKFVADLGWYNPHTDEFTVKADDVQEWMKNGANPTSTVHNLLVEKGIIKGDKVTSWKPKKKEVEEGEAEEEKKEEKPAEEAPAEEKEEEEKPAEES